MTMIDADRAGLSLCIMRTPEGMTAEEYVKMMFEYALSSTVTAGKDDLNVQLAEILSARGFTDDEALGIVF